MAVADNSDKSPLLTVEARVELIRSSLDNLDNITVTSFEGLTANYAKSINATAIIRGLRAVSDFEYEFQMALMNRKIEPTIETVFLMPSEKYSYISSSLIKDIAKRGGDVSSFVPKTVLEILSKKYSR